MTAPTDEHDDDDPSFDPRDNDDEADPEPEANDSADELEPGEAGDDDSTGESASTGGAEHGETDWPIEGSDGETAFGVDEHAGSADEERHDTAETAGDQQLSDEPFSSIVEEVRSDEASTGQESPEGRAGPAPATGETSPDADSLENGLPSHESPLETKAETISEEDTPGERTGPMSDLAEAVDSRRERRDESSELFDEAGVSTVDPEVVWEQLENDDPIDASIETPEDGEERVIDTGKFCERCEYFSSPPDVHCTHEGTEIVELVEIGRFRVLDCPKVKEEEKLEDL